MDLVAILTGYLLGALPNGYILVKLFKKQDITQIGSGRTGGTNAMRAGGFWLGLLTSFLDLLKGFLAIWLAGRLAPGHVWIGVLAGVAAVLGHNYSIWLYLLARQLSAGAGTGPNVGAAMAFWPWIGLILVPVVLFFVFIVGYASLASIAVALIIPLVFLIRALWFGGPWQDAVYGTITAGLVIWALRPNIRKLLSGTERRVGLFAKPKPAKSENR